MAWEDSDRKDRLPADWGSRIVPLAFATYGDSCHVCGDPGADAVDHVRRGDDHSLANLRPIHQDTAPYCHRYKSSAEGVEARAHIRSQRRRPAETHPLDQRTVS